MAITQISETTLKQTMEAQFGTKPTVMYYLKKANTVASRISLDLNGQNTYQLAADAQELARYVNDAYIALAGDDKKLPKEK